MAYLSSSEIDTRFFAIFSEFLTLSSPAFSVYRLPPSPDAKNQCYHQLIEMKLCTSHYNHKGMPDAKFESRKFSIFGDMMLDNLDNPRLKIDRPCQFQQFSSRINFFIFKIF